MRLHDRSPARRRRLSDASGALLACSEAELGEHPAPRVSLLKSEDVPIDWVRLLADLKEWNYKRRPVQRRWARSFWARSAAGRYSQRYQ